MFRQPGLHISGHSDIEVTTAFGFEHIDKMQNQSASAKATA